MRETLPPAAASTSRPDSDGHLAGSLPRLYVVYRSGNNASYPVISSQPCTPFSSIWFLFVSFSFLVLCFFSFFPHTVLSASFRPPPARWGDEEGSRGGGRTLLAAVRYCHPDSTTLQHYSYQNNKKISPSHSVKMYTWF